MIDLGSVYRIRVEVRTPEGVLTNPGAATLTVALPDGSTETPTVTLPPAETGIVTVDYATTQAGRHSYVLATTGPQTSYRDVFDVRTPDAIAILSLADAKKHLNISNSTDDGELRDHIEAATSIIEFHANASVLREFTETWTGHSAEIALRHWPVDEVLAIESLAGGAAVATGAVDVDEVGILRMTGGGSFRGPLRFRYRAGHRQMPAAWVQAAKIIVQHLWETQRPRDSNRPASTAAEDIMSVSDSRGRYYSIPRRAVELLQADMAPEVA